MASTGAAPLLLRRIQNLMLGRVVFITALLGATIWLGDREGSFGQPSSLWLSGLVVTTYALTIVYALWLRRGAAVWVLAPVQAAGDVLFATVICWVTGGPESTWFFLFLVAAIGASLVLARVPALLVTTAGAALFIGTTVLEFTHVMPRVPGVEHLPAEITAGRLWLQIFINVAAMYAVALLTSLLSEQARLVGARLAETRADLAALAQIHGDIVQSSLAGLVTLGSDGRIMSANPAARRILGREETELAALDAEAAARVLALPAPLPPGGRYEVRVVTPAGQEREVGFQVTPLRDAAGAARGQLAIFSDLTELRHAEAALRRSEQFATLGRIAARMAHEIRNPLAAISGAVDLLQGVAPQGSEDRRLMEIVTRETERLNALLTDLLDFARPREVVKVRTDLANLARETDAVFRRDPALEGRRLVVAVEVEPLWADVEPARVSQALWNLLRNAAQATPPGGEVRLGLAREGGTAVFSVRDQGPGVPAAERDRVFEPFFTTKPSGSGIGLAVVRGVAELHGGAVSVRDAPEGGAEFVLQLQIAEAPEAAAQAAAGPTPSPA